MLNSSVLPQDTRSRAVLFLRNLAAEVPGGVVNLPAFLKLQTAVIVAFFLWPPALEH
jgi:hypothetical protein